MVGQLPDLEALAVGDVSEVLDRISARARPVEVAATLGVVAVVGEVAGPPSSGSGEAFFLEAFDFRAFLFVSLFERDPACLSSNSSSSSPITATPPTCPVNHAVEEEENNNVPDGFAELDDICSPIEEDIPLKRRRRESFHLLHQDDEEALPVRRRR